MRIGLEVAAWVVLVLPSLASAVPVPRPAPRGRRAPAGPGAARSLSLPGPGPRVRPGGWRGLRVRRVDGQHALLEEEPVAGRLGTRVRVAALRQADVVDAGPEVVIPVGVPFSYRPRSGPTPRRLGATERGSGRRLCRRLQDEDRTGPPTLRCGHPHTRTTHAQYPTLYTHSPHAHPLIAHGYTHVHTYPAHTHVHIHGIHTHIHYIGI